MNPGGRPDEGIARRAAVERGGERSFGLVWTAVLLIVGLWPLLDGGAIRWWAVGAAVVLAMASLMVPRVLRPLNVAWHRFGLALAGIVNPVVLGVLFFVVLTPTALLMRAFGKDPLTRARDAAAPTYWIPREPPGPAAGSLRNQF